MQNSPFDFEDLLWKAGLIVGYVVFMFLIINFLNYTIA
jgi:hypothetical protein